MSESEPAVPLVESFESQVLGGRVTITWTDDEIKATLVKHCSSFE